jgi:hypothetical protein
MIQTRACRYCGEPIGLVESAKTGRNMPIDPVPDDAGNVVVVTLPGGKLVAHVIGKNTEMPVGTRFMPHFATCPTYPKRPRKGKQ